MNIDELKRACSNPASYIKTKLKSHKVFICRPQIGTVTNIDGISIKTDNINDIIVRTESGELFYKREEVMRMLFGYYYKYTNSKGEERCIYLITRRENSYSYNKELLRYLSKNINGVPIIDWCELEPSKQVLDRDLWTTFVPADKCFDVLNAAPNKFTGAGMFIVCDSMYGAPNFRSRKIVNGITFETMYARSRAFDDIPKSINGDFKVENPKSITSLDTNFGASSAFRKHLEGFLNSLSEHGYISRGYKCNVDGNIDTKYFILEKCGIKGTVSLTSDRKLILNMWYKNRKVVEHKETFSVDGFKNIESFILKGVALANKEKSVKKYNDMYKAKIKESFKLLIEYIKKHDVGHNIKFLDNSMLIESKNVIDSKAFECYVSCNSKYFKGNIIGGCLAVEHSGEAYRYTLTIIGDGECTSTDYHAECTSKGISNLMEIMKETILVRKRA